MSRPDELQFAARVVSASPLVAAVAPAWANRSVRYPIELGSSPTTSRSLFCETISPTLPAQPEIKPAILLVDDQEDDAMLIKHALEQGRVGCPVVRVPGALQAMAYLSGETPYNDQNRYPSVGLVLLDIKMPGVDGFEVLRWIRHNAKLLGLPVVMLTGSQDIQDAKTAYELGATSFFVKPFDFANYSELSHTISNFIKC